jgi:hypothetical protein
VAVLSAGVAEALASPGCAAAGADVERADQ